MSLTREQFGECCGIVARHSKVKREAVEDAWNQIYTGLFRPAISSLFARGARAENVEDIVQTAFLALWRTLLTWHSKNGSYPDDLPFAYFWSILYNQQISYAQHFPPPQDKAEDFQLTEEQIHEILTEIEIRRVESTQTTRQINNALLLLREKQRTILRLWASGWENKKIAVQLECSDGNVTQHRQKAIQTLAKALGIAIPDASKKEKQK